LKADARCVALRKSGSGSAIEGSAYGLTSLQMTEGHLQFVEPGSLAWVRQDSNLYLYNAGAGPLGAKVQSPEGEADMALPPQQWMKLEGLHATLADPPATAIGQREN
jgi:hypothetical protein